MFDVFMTWSLFLQFYIFILIIFVSERKSSTIVCSKDFGICKSCKLKNLVNLLNTVIASHPENTDTGIHAPMLWPPFSYCAARLLSTFPSSLCFPPNVLTKKPGVPRQPSTFARAAKRAPRWKKGRPGAGCRLITY